MGEMTGGILGGCRGDCREVVLGATPDPTSQGPRTGTAARRAPGGPGRVPPRRPGAESGCSRRSRGRYIASPRRAPGTAPARCSSRQGHGPARPRRLLRAPGLRLPGWRSCDRGRSPESCRRGFGGRSRSAGLSHALGTSLPGVPPTRGSLGAPQAFGDPSPGVFGLQIPLALASPRQGTASLLSVPGGIEPPSPLRPAQRRGASSHPHPDTPAGAGRAGSPSHPQPPALPGGGWYSSLRPDRNVLCVRSGHKPGRQSRTLFILPAPAPLLHPALTRVGLDLRQGWGSPGLCPPLCCSSAAGEGSDFPHFLCGGE